MTLKHPQTTPLRHLRGLFYVSTKLATGTRYLANSSLTEEKGGLSTTYTNMYVIHYYYLKNKIRFNLFLLAHFLF